MVIRCFFIIYVGSVIWACSKNVGRSLPVLLSQFVLQEFWITRLSKALVFMLAHQLYYHVDVICHEKFQLNTDMQLRNVGTIMTVRDLTNESKRVKETAFNIVFSFKNETRFEEILRFKFATGKYKLSCNIQSISSQLMVNDSLRFFAILLKGGQQ